LPVSFPQDVIFCREVIIHLPMADILSLLNAVSASGAK
jgi:2-polyprenyl-3-methyl-5-hydroxy-6-metoxy-1,4-benzoquinol methylase